MVLAELRLQAGQSLHKNVADLFVSYFLRSIEGFQQLHNMEPFQVLGWVLSGGRIMKLEADQGGHESPD